MLFLLYYKSITTLGIISGAGPQLVHFCALCTQLFNEHEDDDAHVPYWEDPVLDVPPAQPPCSAYARQSLSGSPPSPPPCPPHQLRSEGHRVAGL